MELENPSQTTRESVKMVKVKKKCCLHKWKEFESISLCPSNLREWLLQGPRLCTGAGETTASVYAEPASDCVCWDTTWFV